VRGLHFQRPPAAQAKLISVLRGSILDVAVDIRGGSPSLGKHVAAELSAQSGYQFYVPIGFAHGFITLEDDTVVLYKVSDYYAPAQESGLRWDDPDIAIAWPLQGQEVTISEKDRRLPLLREFASPFTYSGCPLGALAVVELG
jgi:dTDP-4-dehydrorhamnose 3,5-epimerase